MQMKNLISRAVKGEREDPAKLLRTAGILSLQIRASQSFTTNEAPPIPIERYWEQSPYSKKDYPVRFVARVITEWMNRYAGTYSISPEERNGLDERVCKLLESKE